MIAKTQPVPAAYFSITVKLIGKPFKGIYTRLRSFPGTDKVFHSDLRGALHLFFEWSAVVIIMTGVQFQPQVPALPLKSAVSHPPEHSLAAPVAFQLAIAHFTQLLQRSYRIFLHFVPYHI